MTTNSYPREPSSALIRCLALLCLLASVDAPAQAVGSVPVTAEAPGEELAVLTVGGTDEVRVNVVNVGSTLKLFVGDSLVYVKSCAGGCDGLNHKLELTPYLKTGMNSVFTKGGEHALELLVNDSLVLRAEATASSLYMINVIP